MCRRDEEAARPRFTRFSYIRVTTRRRDGPYAHVSLQSHRHRSACNIRWATSSPDFSTLIIIIVYPFGNVGFFAGFFGTVTPSPSAGRASVGCAPSNRRRRRHGSRGLPQEDPPWTAVGDRRPGHLVPADMVEKRRYRRGARRPILHRRRRLGVSQVPNLKRQNNITYKL